MRTLAKELIKLHKLDTDHDNFDKDKLLEQFGVLKKHIEKLLQEHQHNSEVVELLRRIDEMVATNIGRPIPIAKPGMYQLDIGAMRRLLRKAFKLLEIEIDDEIKELREIGVVPH